MNNIQFAADHWEEVGHFYAPIAFYGGQVLKYQGIATKGNQQHLRDMHPQGVMVDAYKGDRIRAADHSLFQDTA